MIVNEDQTWAARALCAQTEPDDLFVQGAAQRQARAMCAACEVRLECLADALNSRASFGVWGGLTERERRALLRHYPNVENWEDWLQEADNQLAQDLRGRRNPRVLAFVRSNK